MNIGEGFRNIMLSAWNIISYTVVLPAGTIGNSSDITLLNIFMLGLGSIFTIKFLRYCLGGRFNVSADKPKNNPANQSKDNINNFMHEDPEQLNSFLDTIKNNGGRWQ